MSTFADFYSLICEDNLLLKGMDAVKQFQAQKDRMNPDQKIQALNKIYDDVFPQIQQRMTNFVNILKSVSSKYTGTDIKTRIKSFPSVVSKIVARDKSLTDIPDLLAGMILARTNDDVDRIVKDLQRKFGSFVDNVDYKDRGQSKSGYFGAYHIDLDMNGILAEVQVMTFDLYKQKALAHEIYAATRDTGPTSADLDTSRKLFIKGNMMAEDELTFDEFGILLI